MQTNGGPIYDEYDENPRCISDWVTRNQFGHGREVFSNKGALDVRKQQLCFGSEDIKPTDHEELFCGAHQCTITSKTSNPNPPEVILPVKKHDESAEKNNERARYQ